MGIVRNGKVDAVTTMTKKVKRNSESLRRSRCARAHPKRKNEGRQMTQNHSPKVKSTITMNTKEYMPFDCVAPIRFKVPEEPGYFYHGTGFFLQVDDSNDIYFVTAKHCVFDNDGKILGELMVHFDIEAKMSTVIFSEVFYGTRPNNEFPEDVAVYVVDMSILGQKELLLDRCLKSPTCSQVNTVLGHIIESEIKLRIIGFPHLSREYLDGHVQIQSLEHPDQAVDVPALVIESSVRGLNGYLTQQGGEHYLMEQINWPDTDALSGFSGSPVLHLEPNGSGGYFPCPVGVILMGSNNMTRFVSLNVVTDFIRQYLNNELKKGWLTVLNIGRESRC